MSRLFVVGLGPGSQSQLTPEAQSALEGATDLVGYGPYVERVRVAPHVRRHGTDNRVEIDRARHALKMTLEGRQVVVVSGGDSGVFGMASAVFEAIENGPPAWRSIEVTVIPGVTAVLAAAARLGAPLGGDFCVISLSDNLKPWETVCRRLRLAAEAGFVIALYNARSKARPWQLGEAFDLLRQNVSGNVPVAFARAVGRPDERIILTDLESADPELVDMSTLVLIGCRLTRTIARADGGQWLYTSRKVEA
ncbi:precorrin-3B C(17)-methyltransferase [Gluconobacter wancherniae]|uniref:Precorrin-3B C(17)-methyltransferase n=1 Tax=Gluconobacter wancherniae NBRC 103581 TaxID=656744 RepID=A0A511B071_9PROT|nr:precorrin-3B C(17)-methyltransferase [Gluconobacter wancherniae]MBF0853155.1 precorrin-3B C(17)-methyltransferase [Gluconobacter wancherniae]GBD56127.1 precorrin-3B C(17)-methyltransferase [Gluconobacter wancherniae NBRC 103581]GBR63248.1 precorrin-3B C17-methyltransferase [Gluconobacter wancherniae NBRC 103581]GEK92973.1 precorrin-3B C(17)-methyltransferase [Gluconobacter wancherniae NBRC 103581]